MREIRLKGDGRQVSSGFSSLDRLAAGSDESEMSAIGMFTNQLGENGNIRANA